MRNLTFKAAMWKGSQPTVNRQSTDGQSQRHCKQTPLSKRWKVLMTLVFLFTLGIGNVWGVPTQSYVLTGYSSSIANGKTANIGGAYCGRKGSSVTPSATYGLTSGGGNTAAVFVVNQASTITFVMDNQQNSAKSGTVFLASVTDDFYTDCQNGTLGNLPSTASQSKDVSFAKKADSGENEFTFESSVSAGKYVVYWTSGINSSIYLKRIEINATGGGCTADPTAPTKFDTESITENGVTFSITDAANAGKYDIYYSTSNTAPEATTAASATSTAKTKEITGLTASTKYYAWVRSVCDDTHKSDWVALTGDFFTTAAPDPCTTHHWFVATADATSNGVTNWNGFTNGVTGSSGQTNSVTIDGTTYSLTKRTGSTTGTDGIILGFTIPANKAGTLYGYMKSSGTGARTLSLKKGDDVVKTNTEITDGNWTLITISAIAPGTYTLSPDQNVQVQMFVLKVCDAEFHTITFDADGGSTVASISALDGAPATKPADPTKENADFVKWVVKSTGNDYEWTSNVTGDLTLKAVWSQWPKLTLEAGEGATGDAVVTYHKAGSSVAVPAKPEGFSNGTKEFTGWVYSTDVEITDGAFPMPSSGLTLTAQWASATAVAQIVSGDSYETLAQAIAAATDGQTIQLLQDIDVDAQIEIAGVDITIDLNGHKIKYEGDATLPSGVILVHNGASLTINDSSDPDAGSIVSGDKAYAAVALTKLGDDASNPATLVVNGGALTGYYYGITGNGSRNNTVITINGGTITGTVGTAIYNPQVGTLTVNNGTLTGLDAAIEMRAGTLVINDGTFTATATAFSCNSNGSGSTTSGAAIAIAQHTTKKEISVTINGGTFNGVKALNESNPQVNDPAPAVTMAVTAGTFTGEVTTVDVNNFISGGTFDHEVAANQCAEGYAPKDNGDNTYGVKPLAQTFSLEDLVTAQGTGANYTTYLNNLGWTVANEDALDNLNTDKTYDNYPYLGLKFKNATGYVAGEVEGGKLLTIKLGHMAGVAHLMVDDVKKMELDGVDAETPKVHYYYVENTANVKLLMANAGSKQTCVLKAITVADPFTVTFDANGGEDVASLNGTPTVTLPSATKGTDSFLGWFDGETKVGEAGDTYTPTANITLVAHWEAVSTDARLASISFSSDAGTLSPAFDPEVTSYTYTMPYGTASVPTITGATAVNANAQAPVIGTAATAWGEAQTVKGVAQSGAEKIYTVTILRAPKDGVCIIKGNVGNNTFVIDEDASLFAGTADKNNVRENSSTYQEKTGWKFQARPARLGLTLSGDETFQEGDVVEVFVTSVADIQGNNDKMRIFDATDATAAHVLYESEADMIQGANRFVLPATTTKSLYLHRTKDADYDNFNPYVAYVAVYRPMNPVLTAITINGVACDKGEGNAFSVTLPNGTNLGSLTVVPTIVKNGEGGSAAPTAAWAWEDNTYRVTDKDGDYTDYTITLTEAAAPSAAPVITAQPEGADYIEGASIAALEVVATGSGELSYQWYLGAEAIEGATAATYAPAVSAIGSYVYHCVVTNTEAGHPATSLTSDNATITISENSNAIKLFDGEGNLNTTNFISPAKTTIEIADVEHVCLAEFSSNRSSLGGATPTDMVKYDVTTDKAKIQMTFYNNNSGTKKAILYKYEEGGTPEKIEIEVPGQQIFTTEYYEFNSSKNRTFYVCMNDRSNIRVLQVKVIDNGANPVKQFGQVGYSLNLNKARFYAKAAVEKSFEGFTFTPSSDYKVYNNSNLATTSANSFTIASPTVMSVKRSGGKYYVYQDPADKGTLYSADAEIELNATGTWYISSETTSSAASFTKIEFLAPKCEKPTITTQPATKLTFDPGDLTATVVAAEPTDGGTLSYQWYNAANDEEVEGATEATLTTTTPGTYYVVVTNTLAGHQDVSVTSDEAELGYRVTNDATLMALSYGGTAITLEDGVYDYNVELAKGTTDVPALAATATMNGYATVTISNAAEFVNYEASSTVTVKSEDLTVTNVYTVNFTVKHDLPQVDVTETTTWDMTNVSASAIELSGSDKNARLLLANIDGVNNTTFNAQALMFEGQHIGRTGAGIKHLAGRYVQFNVTVPGAVFVTFESNGDNARTISINGKKCSRTTSGTAANDYITYALAVEPGSVEIIGYEGESANQYVRISKIEFKAEYSHRREKLNPSYLGTLCWTNNAVLGGATLYEFAGKNEYNYLVFDEVAENRLEAGKPYIFMPENGSTEIRVYNTDNEEPMTEIELEPVNHMYGTFTGKTLVPGENDNMYYFSASHIWAVKDFTVNITVPAYYCYVDYEAVLAAEPAPAPAHGRRRVTMGVQGQQVATGIEDVQGDKVQCTKMLINGQLFILRGEKMYDAKGQLVK